MSGLSLDVGETYLAIATLAQRRGARRGGAVQLVAVDREWGLAINPGPAVQPVCGRQLPPMTALVFRDEYVVGRVGQAVSLMEAGAEAELLGALHRALVEESCAGVAL